MSRLRVNRISPRTGTVTTIDNWSNAAYGRTVFAGEEDSDIAHGEDVTDALQALLTEAIDAPLGWNGGEGSRKVIELPHGDLMLAKPLLLRLDGVVNLTLRGHGSHLSQLKSTGSWYGPMIVTAPPSGGSGYDDVETGASLYASGTRSLRFRRDDFNYFMLSDSHATRLDGLEEITVEFRVKVTVSANDYCFIGSQGRRGLTGESEHYGLTIHYRNGSGELQARLNVGGTVYNLTLLASELTIDQTYDIAIDYDGTTIRAYLDGAVTDSEAATGTVTQELVEDLALGMRTNGVFENSFFDHTPDCLLDNLRISSVARYAGAYTPSATKHVWDASTVFLLTCEDEVEGPFAVARTGDNLKFWMLMRRQQFGGGVIQQITFEDFAMHGQQMNTWMANISSTLCYFRHLRLQLPGAIGWLRFNNSFLNYTTECDLSGSNHTAAILCQTFVSGFGRQDAVTFNGGIYQHAAVSTSSDSFYNNYYVPSTSTAVSFYGNAGGGDGENYHWEKVGIGQENIGADWETAAMFVDYGSALLVACDIEGVTKPSLTLKGGKQFKMVGGRINSGNGDFVVDVQERAEQPIELDNVKQRGGTVAWTDTGFEDAVIVRESGQETRGIFDAGNSGTSKTLDSSDGTFQKLTATGNCTVTLTMSDGHEIELHYLTGAGSFTASFTSVAWVGGSAPTLTVTATKLDIFRLWKTNGKLYGQILGQNLTP